MPPEKKEHLKEKIELSLRFEFELPEEYPNGDAQQIIKHFVLQPRREVRAEDTTLWGERGTQKYLTGKTDFLPKITPLSCTNSVCPDFLN